MSCECACVWVRTDVLVRTQTLCSLNKKYEHVLFLAFTGHISPACLGQIEELTVSHSLHIFFSVAQPYVTSILIAWCRWLQASREAGTKCTSLCSRRKQNTFKKYKNLVRLTYADINFFVYYVMIITLYMTCPLHPKIIPLHKNDIFIFPTVCVPLLIHIQISK